MNYRLYSITAAGYLSRLQQGLQTAHVVGELFADTELMSKQRDALLAWARTDKTIIILSAFNHGGVIDAYQQLSPLADSLNLPSAIFREDMESMNGMATACGVIVPEQLYDVTAMKSPLDGEITGYRYVSADAMISKTYAIETDEGMFCHVLKSYRMA